MPIFRYRTKMIIASALLVFAVGAIVLAVIPFTPSLAPAETQWECGISRGFVYDRKDPQKDSFNINKMVGCNGLADALANLSTKTVHIEVGPFKADIAGDKFASYRSGYYQYYRYDKTSKESIKIKLFPKTGSIYLYGNNVILNGIKNPILIKAAIGGWSCRATPQWREFRNANGVKYTTPSNPVVAWTPDELIETISPGETKSIRISFVSSRNIAKVAVDIDPELQPFFTVQPSAFSSIKAGVPVALTLIFAVHADSPLGTFDGTIQLMDASSKSSKTFSKPLPVEVNIWNFFQNDDLGFSLKLPSTYIVAPSTDPNWKEVAFSETEKSIEPILRVNIIDLPEGVSLRDWVRSFGVSDANIEEVTLNGKQYLRWFESIGDGMGATSYSTLFGENKVITITTPSSSFASTPDFTDIVYSLNFTP